MQVHAAVHLIYTYIHVHGTFMIAYNTCDPLTTNRPLAYCQMKNRKAFEGNYVNRRFFIRFESYSSLINSLNLQNYDITIKKNKTERYISSSLLDIRTI